MGFSDMSSKQVVIRFDGVKVNGTVGDIKPTYVLYQYVQQVYYILMRYFSTTYRPSLP
jgi:hypothetical protein